MQPITRREFVKRTAVAGAMLTSIPAILEACSGSRRSANLSRPSVRSRRVTSPPSTSGATPPPRTSRRLIRGNRSGPNPPPSPCPRGREGTAR